MPYVKVSRDKRGYETYYLLEGSGQPNQSRPRVLFWFRTPPQIKVGREPFSDEIQQAIESRYPDLTFDWPRLKATQPPSQDAERWRERRRLERAARQAAREEREPEVEADAAEAVDEVAIEAVIDEADQPRHSIEAAAEAATPEPAVPAVSGAASSDAGEASSSHGRRRRRRRRGFSAAFK